jgi:YD repeat-containing protein
MGLQGCHIVDITDRSRRGVILGSNDAAGQVLRVRYDGAVDVVESDSKRYAVEVLLRHAQRLL